MASYSSQLIVSLLDRVSGPARQVAQSLNGMNRRIAESGQRASFGERISANLMRTNEAIDRARGNLIDAVAGFYALRAAIGAPLSAAVDLESRLSGIGSKAGLSADALVRLRGELRQISGSTNQLTADLAGAVDYLVGMGMSADEARAAITSIGIASTATGADVTEMSAAGFAAISNLKVPAKDVMAALDAMAMAGKRGGFELKDMAQYFPNIGSAYAALGQSGTSAVADLAAAMQIMRANTGDASSAATNLQNVIQKMQSPATVRAFKKMGVNLNKELERASKKGLSPIEAIAEITNKTLKGDLSKIGYLFEDSQAQAGVRSLIQNLEQFRDIRGEAMAAQGTNEADFNRAMDTTAERAKSARIALLNIGESIGSSLLPALRQAEIYLRPLLDGFGRLVENHPGVVAGVVSMTAGFIGLKAALGGLRFVGLLGKGGALSILSFAAKGLARAAPGAGRFVTGLSGLGGIVGTISMPVWGTFALAAAAIGGAGLLIWKYWDRLSSIFSGVGEALSEILSPAVEWASEKLSSFNGDIREGVGRIAEYFGGDAKTAVEAYDQVMKSAFDFSYIKGAVEKAKNWLGSLFTQETLTDADKEKARQAGYDFVMSLWNGMKEVFNELVSWVGGKVEELTAPVRNFANKVSGMFGGSSEGVTSDPMGPGVDGQRAKGGPVSRGSTYLVGERGPELITAGRSGYVNKAGSQAVAPNITFGPFTFHNTKAADAAEIASQVRKALRDEVRETFRGIYSDVGLRIA